MTTCKTKRWDIVQVDVNTLCQEIEDFCNSGEVVSVETLSVGRHLLVIVVFKELKNKEDLT